MKNKKQNYTCHSQEEYDLAIEFRKKFGFGEYKISKKLAEQDIFVKPRTIASWIREGKKPFNSKIVTQTPKDAHKLTKEKAYILGVLCGDGYITTCYRVGLTTIDRDFIEFFQCCLSKVYGIKPRINSRERITNFVINPKPQYELLLSSKNIVTDLLRYTNSYKTFEWKVSLEIKNAPKEIQAMFIKGFADSEGSIRIRERNSELTLCSGNESGLKEIQGILLKNFKVKSSFIKRKDNVCIITSSDYVSLNNFYYYIGFVIQRKQNILMSGLKKYRRKGLRKYSQGFKVLAVDMLRNSYTHKEVSEILNTSGANIYDWEKAIENKHYYKEKWQKQKQLFSLATFL